MFSPSLRALRALVVLSHTGSAVAAAERLGVTASAVSHLMAELERQVGAPLFADRRRGRLNAAGERLVLGCEAGFRAIDQAVAEIGRAHASIRISTLSSFAMLWLIPRLPRLREKLPKVDILISTDTRAVDLATEPFDCVIRWVPERRSWRSLSHTMLFREELIKVASPRLTAEPAPRLIARSRPEDSESFGEDAPAAGVTVFETRGQMIEAAIAGLGVAIIDRHLVQGSLAAGHLVQVGSKRVERPGGYVFAAREEALMDRNLRVLRDWLLEEVRLVHG